MTDSHGSPPETEPRTPMWLPALGAALFVSVALWWAVTPRTLPIAADDTAASASAAVAAVPTIPVPPQLLHPPTPGGTRAIPSSMHLNPSNPSLEDRLKKLHEGMAPGGPGRHP